MCRYYRLCGQFQLHDAWEPGLLIFGKFFKSCSKTALFLGSVLAVYQAVTSKTITYSTNTFNLSWWKGITVPPLMLTSRIKFWSKIKRILLSFGLWTSAVDLKLKLLSCFFNVVSELFRFNVSENRRSITLFLAFGDKKYFKNGKTFSKQVLYSLDKSRNHLSFNLILSTFSKLKLEKLWVNFHELIFSLLEVTA